MFLTFLTRPKRGFRNSIPPPDRPSLPDSAVAGSLTASPTTKVRKPSKSAEDPPGARTMQGQPNAGSNFRTRLGQARLVQIRLGQVRIGQVYFPHFTLVNLYSIRNLYFWKLSRLSQFRTFCYFSSFSENEQSMQKWGVYFIVF